MESTSLMISRKSPERRISNHHRSNSSPGLDGFRRCSFCELSLHSSSSSSLFVLFLLRRLRASIIFPLAPAIKVNESLHATPFGDFALHPCEVYRLGIQKLALFLHQVLNLEKAFSPSSRSRCIQLLTLRACRSVDCSPLTPQ
jgi:hypothetical protein